MVRTLKTMIKNLAQNAVLIAEDKLGSGNGQAKKQMAVEYIVKNLPFPEFVKQVLSLLLSKMIDEFVESAVDWLHNQKEIQGE